MKLNLLSLGCGKGSIIVVVNPTCRRKGNARGTFRPSLVLLS